MKVLTIEQMNKLKKLGVDTSIASMAIYDIYAGENKVYDIIASNGAFPEDQEYDRFGYGIHSAVAFCKKHVFTLQDIIELLPKSITDCNGSVFNLCIEYVVNSYVLWYISYDYDNIIKFENEELLQLSYEMLLWVIENGYLKTK